MREINMSKMYVVKNNKGKYLKYVGAGRGFSSNSIYFGDNRSGPSVFFNLDIPTRCLSAGTFVGKIYQVHGLDNETLVEMSELYAENEKRAREIEFSYKVRYTRHKKEMTYLDRSFYDFIGDFSSHIRKNKNWRDYGYLVYNYVMTPINTKEYRTFFTENGFGNQHYKRKGHLFAFSNRDLSILFRMRFGDKTTQVFELDQFLRDADLVEAPGG